MRVGPIRFRPLAAVAALLAVAAAACEVDEAPARDPRAQSTVAPADATAAPAECQVMEKGLALTDGLEESSGLVESRTRPGMYWTHNDSGHDADLFPIAANGRRLGAVRVEGARNRDWEDIAAGRCPEGAGQCLYIADTGDNRRGGGKHTVRLAVVPEPDPRATRARAREYEAVLPGKRTDIEAMALLSDGSLYLVSKGIDSEIELFRWPTPLREGETATLQRVRRLAPRAAQTGDRVTGASASPNGKWVAVRTYAALAFYRTADLLGSGGPFSQLDLEPLAEPQGEAVSLADDGTVLLTSEGPGHHLPGTIARLRCVLPQ
ncbi:MAG: hypothetical protein ACJ8GN_08495 [Longimicrobiaceae bacterium]